MKKRIISAAILILLALPLMIAGGKVFAIAISVIGIFALKEMIDLKKSHGPIPLIMMLIFYVSFLLVIFINPFEFVVQRGLNYSFLCLLFIIYLLPTLFCTGNYQTKDAFYFLGFVLFLGIACHTIILARFRGLNYFLFLLLIPILTDTFAYIFGKLIGKHKITPLISPNKTWEGSILGSLCGTIISSIFYFVFIQSTNYISVICAVLLLSIAGQFGDLLFSKIKRENEIKDFSDLIPGHGGILDRFDSLIFVASVFVLLSPYI